MLETGPIERFARAGHYSSYARCVPSQTISNGKVKGKGNTKNGNRYLAPAFAEAAHYATIWEPTIKKYYQRRCKKMHVMVAKKSIANKLTRACYHMLKKNGRGLIFNAPLDEGLSGERSSVDWLTTLKAEYLPRHFCSFM